VDTSIVRCARPPHRLFFWRFARLNMPLDRCTERSLCLVAAPKRLPSLTLDRRRCPWWRIFVGAGYQVGDGSDAQSQAHCSKSCTRDGVSSPTRAPRVGAQPPLGGLPGVRRVSLVRFKLTADRSEAQGPNGWPKASVGATKCQYKTHSWSRIIFFIFSELAFKRQVPFTRSTT
jgi:hypothetical protein